MIRLLLDQGLPATTAQLLRQVGVDAYHTSELGLAKASDEQIVAFVVSERRWIITLDSDFHSLLAASHAKQPSIVRIRIEGLTALSCYTWITNVMRIEESALIAGAAISVREHRISVRLLPLGKAS